MESKKILAIDFGESNIGLAITDAGANIVFGKGLIRAGRGSLEDIFKRILDLCIQEKVALIVFGYPAAKGDNLEHQGDRMKRIGEKLGNYLAYKSANIALLFEDESFSSFEAREVMAGFEEKALKSKYSEHELAAIIILKRYLKHHPDKI